MVNETDDKTVSRRALPGPIIDRIRDGVPAAELRRAGTGAVWKALVSTAASAQQRGWTQPDWTALLDEPQSRLGAQAKVERHKPLPARRYHRTLANAWAAADRWLTERPTWTRDDILTRIENLRATIADLPLADDDRLIMHAAITIAAKNGTTRPALPWRTLAAETGLTQHRVRTGLARLGELRLLVLERRGYGGAVRRRANLYQLGETVHIPVPKESSMGEALGEATSSMGEPAPVLWAKPPKSPPPPTGRCRECDHPAWSWSDDGLCLDHEDQRTRRYWNASVS